MRVQVEELRQALRVLYDGAALAQAPLAELLAPSSGAGDAIARAQRLRTLILDAIEALQPARPASFQSPATRSYRVLALHYLDGLAMAQIADELHISERQAYRDLARAEESLAEVFDQRGHQGDREEPAAAPPDDALQAELRQLPAQRARLHLGAIVDAAVATVSPLARECTVTIEYLGLPANTPGVVASEPLLRQTLVLMLTLAVSHANGPVALGHQLRAGEIVLSIGFRSKAPLDGSTFTDVAHLARNQSIAWVLERDRDGVTRGELRLTPRERNLLLVIEDNPGAIELYRRYLEGSDGWEVLEAPDSRLSFELARLHQPTAVLLDILMPQQDGWSVLQMLRTQPETATLPVIVCSVFSELGLAAALGATDYLKKPVTQAQLLAALDRCLEGDPQ